jgi:ribosomal protein L11 methyltransferase
VANREAPAALETVVLDVPAAALAAYEAALGSVCISVGLFGEPADTVWRIEGVKQVGHGDPELAGALALACAVSGVGAEPRRQRIESAGWLARVGATFPEQRIGWRFVVRGTHLPTQRVPGRIVLTLDAGLAFGSGEHGSTRGCLRALERTAHRRPGAILDLGTGSGILGIAAAKLLGRAVIATDIDAQAVRVARANARLNGLGPRLRAYRADGWRNRHLAACGPFDMLMANILARPLCRMARDVAAHVAPGATVILSGLLFTHVRQVLAAHRLHGLTLEATLREGPWTTLVLRAHRGASTNSGRVAP